MNLTYAYLISLWLLFLSPLEGYDRFIATKEDLKPYYGSKQVVMIASPGRSGSTLLADVITQSTNQYKVLKTHLLPPDTRYKGKIIFIFSNPDQAAESALFRMLHGTHFGDEHFAHVETADRHWLKKIGGPFNQTEEENLLSYDALGTYQHLKAWFHTRTKLAKREQAQILAIKYENLWDPLTIQAIKDFLHLSHFQLPPQVHRGHQEDLLPQEVLFRQIYNLGSPAQPRYAAYDEARRLWEQAPCLQYFKLKKKP